MRCHRAQRLMTEKAERVIDPVNEQRLRNHLEKCSDCNSLEDQLDRIWDMLECQPAIEPAPESLLRIKELIREERLQSRPVGGLKPHVRWQWVALAACAILAAVLLTRNGPFHHTVTGEKAKATAADHDRWDEQFLQDLDETLSRSAADSLSTYDSWPGMAPEVSPPASSKTAPAIGMRKKEQTSS